MLFTVGVFYNSLYTLISCSLVDYKMGLLSGDKKKQNTADPCFVVHHGIKLLTNELNETRSFFKSMLEEI